MSGAMKPTKAEISAMFRNEQRDKEHLGFTLACQSLLTEADGPLGIRDFAIRLHHRNTEDMYPVLSAFDGYKDDTLHAIRDAERRWWASGFGGLVLEVLHAAVVSSAVVVTGRIAGRPDKLVVLDPVQLSNGRLDVDKGSLAVDEGGVVEVFNRLCVAASAKPVPFGPFPGSVPRDAKPAAKLPPPTTGRPRQRRDKVVEMARALRRDLQGLPEYAVPMKVKGKVGKMQAVSSGFGGCDFFQMKMTQGEVWARLSPATWELFGSERSFRDEVSGPGGVPREGRRVSLDDQDVLEALRYGFRKKAAGMQSKGIMHVGGGVKGNKCEAPFSRLYWADLRDGRAED